jgi:Tfp pilus assembly protein PilN
VFLDRLIPSTFHIKKELLVIEVAITDHATNYYYTHCKKTKNKIDIVSGNQSINEWQIPEKLIKSKVPIILILNGKGVILKKVPAKGDEELNLHIANNLPGISETDFYVQYFHQSETEGFYAFARKQFVQDFIGDLNRLGVNLASVILGAASVKGMSAFWTNLNLISTALYKIEITNNSIDSILPHSGHETEEIKVGGLTINQNHVLGFANAIQYFLQNNAPESPNKTLQKITSSHFEKNKFQFLLLAVVGICFFMAVLNLIVFTSLNKSNNEVDKELVVYQGKYEKINKLLADYQSKKDLIEEAGILGESRLSEFADKLAVTMPNEVQLTNLYFNPKNTKEDNKDSLVTFFAKEIIIKGNCNQSLVINEWVNILKLQKFIKEVNLEKFNYNKDNFLPNFEIKLKTN